MHVHKKKRKKKKKKKRKRKKRKKKKKKDKAEDLKWFVLFREAIENCNISLKFKV